MHLTPCHFPAGMLGSRMSHPDLNLLVTLDVLLAEGSVAQAARRLRLSPSAMSRALAIRCLCGLGAAWCRHRGR